MDIDQKDALYKYLGIYPDKKKHKNPFRNDSIGNCHFFNGTKYIYFVDFASDECKYINYIDACVMRNNCTTEEAMAIIRRDFNIESSGKSNNKTLARLLGSKKSLVRDVVSEDKITWDYTFSKDWFNYFEKADVLDSCKEIGIRPLDRIIRNGVIFHISTKYDPAFGYFNKSGLLYKIYRPLANKVNKFRSIVQVIEGYDYIDYSKDVLFITKSNKDIAVFRSIGYNAIAPSSENSLKLIEEVIHELKVKFKIIIVWFDEDNVGIKNSKYLSEKYNLYYYFTQKSKDPFDLVSKYGKLELIEQISKILENEDIINR